MENGTVVQRGSSKSFPGLEEGFAWTFAGEYQPRDVVVGMQEICGETTDCWWLKTSSLGEDMLQGTLGLVREVPQVWSKSCINAGNIRPTSSKRVFKNEHGVAGDGRTAGKDGPPRRGTPWSREGPLVCLRHRLSATQKLMTR